jgi:hypothetical protein
MKEGPIVYCNEDFLKTRRFLKQKKRLEYLEKELQQHGRKPKIKPLVYKGSDGNEVRASIANQILDVMNRQHDDLEDPKNSQIIVTGDSGAVPILLAIDDISKNGKLSAVDGFSFPPTILGPGGTMELFSRYTGTNNTQNIVGVLEGNIPSEIKDVRIRNVTVNTYDKNDNSAKERIPVNQQSYHWLLFIGSLIDGRVIEMHEKASRNGNKYVNLGLTGLRTLNYVMDSSKPPTGTESVITFPYFGPFSFNRKRYDALSEDYFFNISFHTQRGLDALQRFAVYNLVGTNSKLNDLIWEHFSGWSALADSGKPRKVKTHKMVLPESEPYYHIDSFPQKPVPDGYKVELEISSTNDFIKIVKVKD